MKSDEYFFFIAQYVGLSGMLVVLALAIWRHGKEQRDKKNREAGRSLTALAAPEPDRPDWRGAPAGKPR